MATQRAGHWCRLMRHVSHLMASTTLDSGLVDRGTGALYIVSFLHFETRVPVDSLRCEAQWAQGWLTLQVRVSLTACHLGAAVAVVFGALFQFGLRTSLARPAST